MFALKIIFYKITNLALKLCSMSKEKIQHESTIVFDVTHKLLFALIVTGVTGIALYAHLSPPQMLNAEQVPVIKTLTKDGLLTRQDKNVIWPG